MPFKKNLVVALYGRLFRAFVGRDKSLLSLAHSRVYFQSLENTPLAIKTIYGLRNAKAFSLRSFYLRFYLTYLPTERSDNEPYAPRRSFAACYISIIAVHLS